MSPDPIQSQLHRFVGLTFAAADVALEVDGAGRVAFATGAAGSVLGRPEAELVGSDWTELAADEPDRDLLRGLSQGVSAGERQGPFRVGLANGRRVWLSVFRLPGAGGPLSCAINLGGYDPPAIPRTAEGLLDAEGLETATAAMLKHAESIGAEVQLDLVELNGFTDSTKSLKPGDLEAVRRRVAAALRAESFGGVGASELAPDRFALLRQPGASPDRAAARLADAAGVTATWAELPLSLGSAALNAKAMRYALDRFIEDGPEAAKGGFGRAVERMVSDSTRFKSVLDAGAFHLVYQPIVRMADESLHHFEALARFDASGSPADTIRLAEELGMILDFDLAVAAAAAAVVAERNEISIAVNLSARSLIEPRFFDELLGLSQDPGLRARLLLEVTETFKLPDLDEGARVLSRLRDEGFRVCLDDFGAGAASLDYLRVLPLDFVKVDGRFIQDLKEGGREIVMLRHVASLCRELSIGTVAEMIETRAVAALVKGAGIDLGQGWAFGAGKAAPEYQAPVSPTVVRREGVVEQWR